jgi:GT2 family glycosyltransferase
MTPAPVCIVGMHRSGTSLVARLLEACGLFLGREEDMMPAHPDNPEGFWEHVGFVELNDELLNALGGAHDEPPPSAAFSRNGSLAAFRPKAQQLVREMRGEGRWGWKDPRTSLTLPFWLDALPAVKVVVCLRNPLEVAASLKTRNYHSYAHGLALWRLYNERILEATRPDQRIVTHYEAYFRDPQAELQRVLAFCELAPRPQQVRKAAAAIKQGMRHKRFTSGTLVDAGVTPEIQQLYAELCAEAEYPDAAPARRGKVQGPLKVSVVEAEELREQLAKARANAQERERALEQLRSEVAAQTERVREAAAEAEAYRARVEELHSVHEALGAAGTALARVERALEEHGARLAELAEQVQGVQGRTDALANVPAELNGLAARTDALHEQLEDVIQLSLGERDAKKLFHYRRLVRRTRDVVLDVTPADSRFLVVSRGDAALLEVAGRVGWQFPQTPTGEHAGFNPASSGAAIAHLEFLRAQGAEFLVFPATELWWLDHYDRFARLLERRYDVAARDDGVCVIYDLRRLGSRSRWSAVLDDAFGEFEACFDREPAVLDWSSGFDVAGAFPEYAVFSPPVPSRELSYMDGTADIVVLAARDEDALLEARRVAAGAVVQVAENGDAEVEWLRRRSVSLPSISIVIPSYNGIEFTERCVRSILETTPRSLSVEVVVVDDCSTDDTHPRLQRLTQTDDRITVLRNEQNQGFLATCNRGARESTGDIVLFLNNDTIALPGWLPPLLRVFKHREDAGGVGGKLIFPDGRLQEAGGIVFSDGRAANFGKGQMDPDDPLFDYLREVDYVSGAHLAFRRSFLEQVGGGFDERFRPIYYEDTDLCFAVRACGLKVYYQPESAIVHVEGGTSGTDESRGDKRYQVVNRKKFVAKWRQALLRQPPHPGCFDLPFLHRLAVREEHEPRSRRR